MIRRIAGRVRRAAAASLVPLAHLDARTAAVRGAFRRIARALAAAWRRPAALGAVRVGVDIRPFYEPLTGVGWYLYFLLEELVRRDDVEIVCFGDASIDDGGPRLHVSLPGGLEPVAVDLRGLPVTRAAKRLAAAAFPAIARLTRCDLFFGANYFLPRALSAIAARRVITVHDLTYRRHPELLQEETLRNLAREMLREVARADAVICVSESTRADLLEHYPVDPRKVRAILSGPPPARPAGARPSNLPERYILFVSTIEPRKNLGVLVEAFETLKDAGYPGELLIAGRVGWKSEATLQRIAVSRWSRAMRRLDYVGRDELPWLYRGADAFVLPSRYEGFGLPVLEAMQEGVPVVAARNSSLPEVGGDAAVYFATNDPGELAAALRRVTEDDAFRSALIARAPSNLARFSWERAAAETAAVFRRVAR